MKTIEKKGFIVIQHSILTEISEEECEKVISANYYKKDLSLYFEYLKIRPVSDGISHKNITEINWKEAAALQERIVENQLKPLLQKFPDHEVIYFGAAPIPLAIHLGYLMEDWRRVNVFLRHHKEVESQKWYQKLNIDNIKNPGIITKGIPSESYNINDDVIVKVQVSYAINEDEVKKSITSDVVKTIDISLEELTLDLNSVERCKEISDKFESAIKAIVDYLPNTDTIHLILTIPVGMAFLFGRKIRSNINRPVQTYQYNRNADFPYDPVLTINQSYIVFNPLTEKEVENANSIRKTFKKNSWQNLQSLIENNAGQANRNPDDNWLDFVLGKNTPKGDLGTRYWKNLQKLNDTALSGREFNLNEDIEGYDYCDKNRSWGIGNRMLNDLHKRLTNIEDVERAIRLILIHEGLHYYQHNLSLDTVEGIGRFPKIIEDVDYQSDVYAILYEYSYSKLFRTPDVSVNNLGDFFAKTIDIAIAALWSFNDPGVNMKEIQVRRINRFLIWYWQYLALSDSRVKSIEDVIRILATKPVIEIKGLLLKTEGERVECQLERYEESNLELAIFTNNKIHRFGNTGFLRLADLINGFRDRDHERIKTVLQGFYRSVMN